jgi:phage-related protein
MAGSTVVVSVLADVAKFTSGLNSADSALAKFGKGLGGVAAGAGVAMAAVTAGAVALGTKVVQSFAALEQNMGGSVAVFGDYAGQIQALGAEAYKNLGLSQSDYLATANKMSALFQGSGISQAKSLDLTTEAMQRAADVASVMGISTESAMESIAGAAKGNFTMMDNLGVAMTEASLRAYAAEQGMENWSYATSTAAEKSELAIAMFLDRTGYAAGNFAREATETVSGSLGLLSASTQSLVAGLGNANADVAQLAGNVVDAFGAVVNNVGPVVDTLATSLPTAIQALLSSASTLLPQLITLVAGLAVSIGDSAGGIVTALVTGIVGAAPQLATGAVGIITGLVTALLPLLPMILDAGLQMVTTLASGLADAVPTLIPVVIDTVIAIAEALIANMPMMLTAALDLILGLATGLIAAIPQLVAALPALILGIVTFVIGAIPQIIQAGITLLTSLIAALPDIIIAIVTALPQIIVGIIAALLGAIPQLIEAGITLITSLVTALPEIIVAIVAAVPQIWDALVSAFEEFDLIEVGKNVIKGLWDGIVAMGTWLWDMVTGFVDDYVIGPVLDVLGIHSPSRVFRGIGQNVIRGLEGGLSAPNNLTSIAGDLAADLSGAFDAGLSLPSLGGSVSGNREPQSVTTVTVIQNNPLTRDPLKQLREESEMVAAGIWG